MKVRGCSDDVQMMVRWSNERQVNVKSQSELDIGGRETCLDLYLTIDKTRPGVDKVKPKVLFKVLLID